MMKSLLLLAVFDVKVGAYLPPFTALAIGQASRMFEDAVRSVDSPFNKHPEDYRLFLVGHWDEGVGSVENVNPPQLVRDGMDCTRFNEVLNSNFPAEVSRKKEA